MPDATELTKAIKKAASKAVKAEKPVEVCFGKVTSASPLQILVDQKFTLGAAQLVLSRNVTDFTTNVTVSWNTENKSGGSGTPSVSTLCCVGAYCDNRLLKFPTVELFIEF